MNERGLGMAKNSVVVSKTRMRMNLCLKTFKYITFRYFWESDEIAARCFGCISFEAIEFVHLLADLNHIEVSIFENLCTSLI